MHYILDRFHAKAHIDNWCKLNVNPDTQANTDRLAGRNTSACEMTFSWMGKYKRIFRTMHRWTANFLVQEMVDLHNEDLLNGEVPAAFTAGSSTSESSGSTTTSGI